MYYACQVGRQGMGHGVEDDELYGNIGEGVNTGDWIIVGIYLKLAITS